MPRSLTSNSNLTFNFMNENNTFHQKSGEGPSRHHRNAGFIRQRPVRFVALPDKSGVPAKDPFPVCGGLKMLPSGRQPMNRWVIAVAGIVMQVALGAVYAWSVFRIPL